VERRRRAATVLAQERGRLTPRALRELLRDHYDVGRAYHRREFEDPRFFSLCMHADPLDNTTASMVASLPADPDAVVSIGVSLGSPCVGAFLPVFLDAEVPAPLSAGPPEPDDVSLWWRLRWLLDRVEADPAGSAARVRSTWDEFENALWPEAEAVVLSAARRVPAERAALLTEFSASAVRRFAEQ